MILEFNQIKAQPDPIFEGKIEGKVVITGRGKSRNRPIFLECNGTRIDFDGIPHQETINGVTSSQVTNIYKNGERIGYHYPDIVPQRKILFFTVGYSYFVFHYEGIDYTAYEVGFGGDEHYLCVYESDETVAIIQKKNVTINYHDQYTIFALDDKKMLAMAALTLEFDNMCYVDYGGTEMGVKETTAVSTPNKELIAKYDPTFIPRVKAMHGILG